VDKVIEYAPIIIVLVIFFIQYKIFVTPEQMTEKFVSFEQHLEEKFVLKETYTVAISELKDDMEEIKETVSKIYDLLIKG
jgi:Tfp pilus assembly protein PilO